MKLRSAEYNSVEKDNRVWEKNERDGQKLDMVVGTCNSSTGRW